MKLAYSCYSVLNCYKLTLISNATYFTRNLFFFNFVLYFFYFYLFCFLLQSLLTLSLSLSLTLFVTFKNYYNYYQKKISQILAWLVVFMSICHCLAFEKNTENSEQILKNAAATEQSNFPITNVNNTTASKVLSILPDDSSTSIIPNENNQSLDSTQPTIRRVKRIQLFRPLFVYRQQQIKKQRLEQRRSNKHNLYYSQNEFTSYYGKGKRPSYNYGNDYDKFNRGNPKYDDDYYHRSQMSDDGQLLSARNLYGSSQSENYYPHGFNDDRMKPDYIQPMPQRPRNEYENIRRCTTSDEDHYYSHRYGDAFTSPSRY